MQKITNKKGQGSFISGDVPSIIMIVLSIGFFLSSIYMADNDFQGKKSTLDMEAALVDAASTFLKENAKIRPGDLTSTSQYWADKLMKITRSYGVNIYVELNCTKYSSTPPCDETYTCDTSICKPPPPHANVLSKRFPIAMRGETDLDVYPALIKVTVYK